jgi:presenilin-like A22 family membrane protease
MCAAYSVHLILLVSTFIIMFGAELKIMVPVYVISSVFVPNTPLGILLTYGVSSVWGISFHKLTKQNIKLQFLYISMIKS